jgi:hypothetical protein
MDEATEQIRAVQDSMLRELEEKKQIVRTNQLELKSQLQDLVDTEKYLKLIDERNKEIEREKEKNGRRFGQEHEKGQFEDVKTEIHINEEYFRNAGIELEDDLPEDTADEPERDNNDTVEPENGQQADVIDLSGATWEVDGLDNPKEESEERPKRHFFKR